MSCEWDPAETDLNRGYLLRPTQIWIHKESRTNLPDAKLANTVAEKKDDAVAAALASV